MFKSSAGKFLFGFSLFFAASCGNWRAEETAAPTAGPAPFVAAEIKSEIPFSTKEPEIYQTELINQIYNVGEKTERKVFTARNGGKRLTVFNVDESEETSLLELETNQIFLINRRHKIYTEMQTNSNTEAAENVGSFTKPEWLNQKTGAQFENLGVENGLSKFRVRLGDAEMPNSEILIYVDENLRIPVRQEFYGGEQKVLTFSSELKNFKSEAGADFFEVPKEYRKVAAKEFQKISWRNEGK